MPASCRPGPKLGQLVALACLFVPGLAGARPVDGLDLGFAETLDVVSVLSGGEDERVRALDNTDLTLDADLDTLVGWRGARAHVYVLGNHGARPNETLGILEGFDNIEVGKSGVRLFEAWVEQDLGESTLLAGLFDVNSEFYVTDSAGTLVSPPFGIGSELAGSGLNGPSIFPSSALALRSFVPLGERGGFVRAALVNANASSWGDPGGIDVRFGEGLLALFEGGIEREGFKIALGGWAYTKRHETIWATVPDESARNRRTRGLYALIDAPLATTAAHGTVSFFARGGLIAGQTTPFRASAQAGLLLGPVLASRPASAVSLGVHSAWTSQANRANFVAQGDVPAAFERGIELTYVDEILPGLTLQPDIQVIQHTGSAATAPVLVIGLLRLSFAIE